jgi:SNF2-related domain
MALSHCDVTEGDESPLSLIVCPSTLVGHWMAEIAKFFPGCSVFRPLCYMGSKSQRESLRHSMKSSLNVIVTSYAVLRNDADVLTTLRYRLCALDEGHLLKNHMTGASPPSRLRSYPPVGLTLRMIVAWLVEQRLLEWRVGFSPSTGSYLQAPQFRIVFKNFGPRLTF